MDIPIHVTVYNFWTRDYAPESKSLSKFKAPREVIVDVLKAEIVEGTGQEVLRSELDNEGRYRRIATGWGELG